ncbi:iron-containing alcohol dehydrogenase [Paenibacillus alvei]|uniref:Iron-containing alcohol dehydrogenase n=1 Tax=Paenibacillus alvei TaxID=44250 RepID=A0ABT4E8B2_PAEAL|nr:1-propanol dehydrogenase PduQ [Paenibacillus alvei]MCY9529976.1 iron-containing alcohol dehydrogenase [Paenibacillus alvei]
MINEIFVMKSKVYSGEQSLQNLAEIQGKKAFIVSDQMMEKLGYLGQVVELLQSGGISSAVYTGVKPDPSVSIVAEALQVYWESGANVLLALGGGSVIDTAKGVLYFARQYALEKDEPFVKPSFVAIPSTSGTGSEVTDFSVITAGGDKMVIVDNFIAPDIAILDSTLTKQLPNKVVVDTGMDVLTHALEAYVSTKATDFTDALAEKAVQLVFAHLETLYHDPADAEARDRVQNASCMAGMAFTNAGLGIIHSMSHAFGGTFHIAHGRVNSLLLEAVMEYNANLGGKAIDRVCERYARLASLLHLPARTSREGTVSLIQAIGKLKRSIGIENGIGELGVDQDAFDEALSRMVRIALVDRCTPTSPRQPTLEELEHIYRKSF